jgi:hypothetical protein
MEGEAEKKKTNSTQGAGPHVSAVEDWRAPLAVAGERLRWWAYGEGLSCVDDVCDVWVEGEGEGGADVKAFCDESVEFEP